MMRSRAAFRSPRNGQMTGCWSNRTSRQELVPSGDGAGVLSGGAGSDTFDFFKKGAFDATGFLGVDRITDLAAGETLDIRDFHKGQKWNAIGDVARVTVGAAGSTLSLETSAGMVDVVTLDGVRGQSAASPRPVHGQSAADHFAAGMLLA